MSAKVMPEERETEFQESVAVLLALEKATAWHLETEFVVYFLRAIREGKSVDDAIDFAKKEWDLL